MSTGHTEASWTGGNECASGKLCLGPRKQELRDYSHQALLYFLLVLQVIHLFGKVSRG